MTDGQPKRATVRMTHQGYALRMPPRGVHDLSSRTTPDDLLFVVTHLGLAEVDPDGWHLLVDGLASRPKSFALSDLDRFTKIDVVSVHECAGSPLAPTEPKRRVGNVRWSGIRLIDLLDWVGVSPRVGFIWSEGLEWGSFAGLDGVLYAKDMPWPRPLTRYSRPT